MDSPTNIVRLRQPEEIDDPLTEVLRAGARCLLAQAVELEAEAFLSAMQDLRLPDGRARLVRQGSGLVHHSERGSQYLALRYTERLAGAGIDPSVGSVGDSYDNALAETINGLFKVEVIHRRGPWRSFEAVEYATLEWVDWYNHRRLLAPIGNVPPAEAEARYHANVGDQALAA